MPSPARKVRTDEPSTIVLDNHKLHLKALWYRENPDTGDITTPKGSSGKTWILLPGLNDSVPAKMWAFALENREWKRWHENGDITVVEEPPTKWDKHAVAALIERSACVQSIERWRKVEKRRDVRKALDKKMIDMRKTAPVRDASAIELGEDEDE